MFGAGYAGLVLIALGLSYLPGGLNFTQVLIALNAFILLLALANAAVRRQATSPRAQLRGPIASWESAALAASCLASASSGFPDLGYSELHGDEALVALRSIDVIQGWERALFVHKKGPAEILLATVMYLLTGQLTEYVAHISFAVASWVGILATYSLTLRWFGNAAAWWAAAMVAVDGYLMAFGRMLQYQSLVFLLVILTVLSVQLAVDQRSIRARALLLAALVFGCGLLAHYEAGIAAIPASWLLFSIWREQEGGFWQRTKSVAQDLGSQF